jgi:ribonuclease E
MANKMLIDSTHPEETRVVVLRGNRVEEFDFESANRRQLRGNIYLAKVTRVEPSLQAAFIDYGGNRHGFLAFSEIHPDYYQIPVADRQALIAEEERAHRDAEAEIDRRASRRRPRREHAAERHDETRSQPDNSPGDAAGDADVHLQGENSRNPGESPAESLQNTADEHGNGEHSPADSTAAPEGESGASERDEHHGADDHEPHETEAHEMAPHDTSAEPEHTDDAPPLSEADTQPAEATEAEAVTDAPDLAPENGDGHGNGNITEIEEHANGENGEEEVIESVGGADALEEAQERTPRYRRSYKIQEVIKRRQIMLVQVVKEERGTKGAALTTYLSLAGRYSVLMPNTARGGGISRKITNPLDRKKLKEIAQELEVPEGMGVILRTAGANRTKTEVKRDFEYLLRLWETVRDLTLKSSAPRLVYEEGSLVKRSIRDLYNKDIDEILVAGEHGYAEARDFMRMLMPSHTKNVKLYRDPQPIFTRYGIESQLDSMFQPVMQLRSGGYIVLNQTEALVAIDVNSGRATREHHIEDTALKTNLEAAEEIARQLRLRDLAGLVVIDFIDMDENRNNRHVERKLKEALKHDRARIQVGRISHFGLMEMSRQRIRSSVLESSTDKCPHCGGTGHVRSVSSVALHLLRMLEEMLLKGATHNLMARTRPEVALYVLNQKRAHLRDLESRFQIAITVSADESVGAAQSFLIEKGEQVHSIEAARALVAQQQPIAAEAQPAEDEDLVEEEATEESGETGEAEGDEAAADSESEESAEAGADGGDNGHRRGRRRRRGRGGRGRNRERDEGSEQREDVAREAQGEHAVAPEHEGETEGVEVANGEDVAERHAGNGEQESDGERRRRRRGRRGGRRNRRGREGEEGYTARNGEHDDQPRAQENGHGIEPELVDASADLGGPTEVPAGEPASTPQPFEPVARDPEPDPASTEPPAPEPSRRRSTVREAAPMFSAGPMSETPPPAEQVPPPPEPAATPDAASSEAETTGEPAPKRRFGWWSRKG